MKLTKLKLQGCIIFLCGQNKRPQTWKLKPKQIYSLPIPEATSLRLESLGSHHSVCRITLPLEDKRISVLAPPSFWWLPCTQELGAVTKITSGRKRTGSESWTQASISSPTLWQKRCSRTIPFNFTASHFPSLCEMVIRKSNVWASYLIGSVWLYREIVSGESLGKELNKCNLRSSIQKKFLNP